MKIAVVTWIVNDVGGINSWTENIIEGFRSNGHKVQLYYGSHQKKMGCHPTKKVLRSRRFHLLPSKLLSYRTKELSRDSVKVLNGYDLILFAHPSPHPTRANTECSNPRGWQEFYSKTKPFKICVFHDRHWDRSNKWIAEVRKFVDYAHAAQYHFLESVRRFSERQVPFDWGMFPLQLKESPPSNRRRKRRIVLATQWLSIKNHRHLIPNLLDLSIPVHSYGSGQMYHKLLPTMKGVYRQDYHYDTVEVYNKKSRHIHYGHREYSQVIQAMENSWFSLDMSVQGMTNMTHWEPMTVGAVSIIENRVLSDSCCKIPRDCCLSFGLSSVVRDLNKISKLPRRRLISIQQRSWRFIQRCECSFVSKDLLRKAKAI